MCRSWHGGIGGEAGHTPTRSKKKALIQNQSMKRKYTYDDAVKVRASADPELRPGATAWVVGVFETRPGPFFDRFPEGVVYTVEFEDGSSTEVHEQDLEPRSA
jgi:hypothetical protein